MNSKKLFAGFNDLKILIVGDVILDRYLDGHVHRISPEAPVPIVHLQKTENRLGGAANVALNIRAMGATPYLFSVVGEDDSATIFEQLLPQNDLWAEGIFRSDQRCTTVKTRIMANHQQLLRVDRENLHDLSLKEADRLLRKIKPFLEATPMDAIILQDYNKGVLSLPVIRKILLEALKVDVPVIVDPKKNHFFEYRNVRIFKPNLKEVKDSLPFAVDTTLDSLKKASTYLRSKSGNKNTMITLSEKGIFIDDSFDCRIIPTQIRNIADVCGAGDSVISLTALGWASKLNLEEIAILANLAGGQVCEKVGVVPVEKNQLEREYNNLLKSKV
ncbi:MAG: bifunctional ADP-heptose synthase [Bacteroidota bacterium]